MHAKPVCMSLILASIPGPFGPVDEILHAKKRGITPSCNLYYNITNYFEKMQV